MKKGMNNQPVFLIFSVLLFCMAMYFIYSSPILGASAGGNTPITAIPMPSSDLAEKSASETTKSSATTESSQKRVPKEVYVVKKGQTLWEIAQDSGLSVQTLMNRNQLSNSVIITGQELVINYGDN